MTILTSLAQAYDRLPDAAPFGYSFERVSWLISLDADGTPNFVAPLGELKGKKPTGVPMLVPQPEKKSVNISANFLWGNTAYVLGVVGKEKKAARLAKEHTAFKELHAEQLSNSKDAGLQALLKFLEWWSPGSFVELGWPDEMKDANVAFALESDRLSNIGLHDREAAKEIWAQASGIGGTASNICLVTGQTGPTERLHPAIKGVWGAQTSGASIVSFNLDAFESYGHEQGENAPVSEAAAFKYTTALNHLLSKGSNQRIQIGDASTVFWADASAADAAEEAESIVAAMFGAEIDESMQAAKVGDKLEMIRQGKPLRDINPKLEEGVRFYVLGLAPNAARLSIRFWFAEDFGVLARNYERHIDDIRLDTGAADYYPALGRYLVELVPLKERDRKALSNPKVGWPKIMQGLKEGPRRMLSQIGAEWLRAMLTGAPYPLALLSTVLMRLRADQEINVNRARMLKAVLVRNFKQEVPVALDPENPSVGYQLGRLFAILERLQKLALGDDINATIRDRYYGSASAAPRNVFPILLRLNVHHRSKAESDAAKRKLARYFAKLLGEITSRLPPDFPSTLTLQEQGQFAIGYYHQQFARKARSEIPETEPEEASA